MLRQIAFALLSFTAAACGGSASSSSSSSEASDAGEGGAIFVGGGDGGSASSDAPSDPHPAWLVGYLTGPAIVDDNGDARQWSISLEADGTAETASYIVGTDPNNPNNTKTDTTWAVAGDTLQIGSDSFGLKLAAQCAIVQLIDGVANRTYYYNDRGPSPTCPVAAKTLNEYETKLAKSFSWTAGPLLLLLEDSGAMELFNSVSNETRHMTFSVDADGMTMRWTDPDGTEIASGSLSRLSSVGFEYCQTGTTGCKMWDRD